MSITKRQKYTVVSMMKDEGPYILEWVAHQKTLGFDDIVVFSNYCGDTAAQILDRLDDVGLVEHHRTEIGNGTISASALKQAENLNVVENADWVFVCDADEFLNIHVGSGKVRDLVAATADDADAITVTWRIFGSKRETLFRNRPVLRQFYLSENAPAENSRTGWHFKTLSRNAGTFSHLAPDRPIANVDEIGVTMVYPNGEASFVDGERTDALPDFLVAQLNHYPLRSMEAFLVKAARGQPNGRTRRLGLRYWNTFDRNDVADTSIERYSDVSSNWHTALLSDPALSTLHRQSVRWHRRRANELRMEPEFQKMIAKIQSGLDITDQSTESSGEEEQSLAHAV
jgi:hypothetical protein